MAKTYLIPGNYRLSSILLTNFDKSETFDIKFLVNGFFIEESLFSPAVFGEVIVDDSIGLHLEFPIFGQETIQFIYSTDDVTNFPNVTREFRVFKMSNKVENSFNACTYKLHFVSEEWVSSESQRVARSFVNQSTGSIVRKIYDDLGTTKKINIEETINAQRILVPYMKPFDAINWLGSYAISARNPYSSYLFFENLDGYNFVSIDSLLNQDAIETFERVQKLSSNSDKDKQDRGPDFITTHQAFDSLGSLSSGLLGSNLQTFDVVTRSYKLRQFSYDTDFTKVQRLENGTLEEAGLFTKNSGLINSEACRKFIITPTAQIESRYIQSKQENNYVFSKRREETLQSRLAQLLQLDQIKTQISVPGDSRLKAGCVIELKIPSFANTDSGTSPYDPYYSGRFLVKKVRNTFQNGFYKSELTLMKDSVGQKRQNVKLGNKNK